MRAGPHIFTEQSLINSDQLKQSQHLGLFKQCLHINDCCSYRLCSRLTVAAHGGQVPSVAYTETVHYIT